MLEKIISSKDFSYQFIFVKIFSLNEYSEKLNTTNSFAWNFDSNVCEFSKYI